MIIEIAVSLGLAFLCYAIYAANHSIAAFGIGNFFVFVAIMILFFHTLLNPYIKWWQETAWPVSYTHLDVYKRQVVAEIAEAYAPKIKPGNKVIVFFPDFNTEVNSTIRFTSKYINPVNRTFVSEVRLGPSNVQYRANMMAVVRINDCLLYTSRCV